MKWHKKLNRGLDKLMKLVIDMKLMELLKNLYDFLALVFEIISSNLSRYIIRHNPSRWKY